MIKSKKQVSFLVIACIFTITLLFLSSCNKEPVEPVEWQTNYEQAIIQAKTDNKPIFAIFTGLSWDAKSATLKAEIFDTDNFKNEIAKSFVPLMIDIDANNESIPFEIAQKNYNLAVKIGLTETPAIILFTQNGIPFTQLDFGEFSITSESILSLLSSRKDIISKFTKLENAIEGTEGMARVKAIDAFYEALPDEYHLIMGDVIREIPDLDPQNESGLLGKYLLMLTYADAQSCIEDQDSDGALQCFINLLEKKDMFTTEENQELLYSTAVLAAKIGKSNDVVLDYLQQAYDADTKTENASYILEKIKQLKGNN
ncbi:MAG: hypothetical protein BKP49_07900 [Treponema sp. CETP13]|nr:MAG: hypothetical protein BKP49_07900 [Treponema sp. CETP13]